MSVIISGAAPNSIAATLSRNRVSVANIGQAPATKPAPAATVEISSGARHAQAAGQGRAPQHKLRPLNIIWGNGPQ